MNDREITRYLVSDDRRYSAEDLADYIRRANDDPSQFMLGMFLKTDQSHIGNIKLDSIDLTHKTANVGLIVGERRMWGRGFGSEAIETITRHAFTELGIRKLCAGCYHLNHGSISAFLKAGYRQEGVRASQFTLENRRVDEILLGRVSEQPTLNADSDRIQVAVIKDESPQIAVLGLGSIGLRHARNLKALGADPVGFDPDQDRRHLAEKAGIRIVEDRESAIKSAQGVVVASPNACHRDDMSLALGQGLHVLVEKPLAHTDDGIPDVLKNADASGLVVFSGFNLRFHPCVRRAEEALREESIGKLLWARLICSSYLPDWRPRSDYTLGYAADRTSGGVLFDNCHEIDLANHLFGPASVVGASARNTGTLEIESEDCVDILLRHASGMTSGIHLDYVTRPACRITEIVGENGRIELDLIARCFTRFDATGETVEREEYEPGIDNDYVAEMQGFLDCLAGRAPPPCDGWQALGVLQQILSARQLAGLPSI